MESVQKQLEELGLSPNEVKVFVAALESGAATAQQLAAKAAVVRPTAYVAIGGLVKRGLMSSHTRGKKQFFQAERPAQLLRLIEEEKKKLAERESKLKSLLPGLESLIAIAGEKPEVKYYEGLDGLETMRKAIFESKAKEFYAVINVAAVKNVVPESSMVLHSYRLKKSGIKGKQILITQDKKPFRPSIETKQFSHKIYRENKEHHFAEIAIFGNYVALTAYLSVPYGFVLKSADVAGVARLLFSLAWESGKLKLS